MVSVSNCVIYILPLLLSYNCDDIVVSCCDKQHLYVLHFVLVANWGGGGGGGAEGGGRGVGGGGGGYWGVGGGGGGCYNEIL